MPIFTELRSLRVAPIALCILITACGQEKAPKKGPVEVGVVTLAAQNVTVSSELPARTVSTMQSEVRPQITGVIQKRLFTEGSMVTAGQPLYQIDERLYRASRDEAQAALVSAQATAVAAQAKAQRYRGLGDTEAVSAQDRDDVIATARQAAAAVGQARASLDTANVNLTFTQVRAPISGRIGRTLFTPGALVTASQTDPLTTIQQLDPIYVDVTQSSSQLLQLRRSLAAGKTLPASATIRLKLDDGSEYPLEGRIEFAEPIVDVDSGTVTLRARFPNPDGMLLPGMFVRVVAPQSVVPGAILAPQQGIARDAKGNATALVVTKDNKVERRTVTAAQAIGDKWLITAGLKAGDRLIVEGTDKVQPDDKVKPVAVAAKK
ncbi:MULTISPECIES: efflux RND transporter periplasmic adaptor subunit [Sphingobium]|jgi:membrane fusion protein (multidrug efflux system)|uniref:Efflux RND transporter periplasmic adaptor subunit n=1 Tax=Sphingobium yanoikuyae TaxID=13690 RepID=A0A084EDG6_SPHYA|nr:MULTISPECIES: efflux RND transporter periplasmic adaptor subunit [Sphingobium]KEZ16008.1 RND family efflux transporter, MFP subunit precursor [Sphingobium yanoikuyae]KMW28779.1 acriflavine resistance protein E [Sphingobium yanoikuyae]MBR2269516.1 efflux RND transporter periplasmic adaptor subunit [Sphingobium sp.]MDH2133430.1 efflux RND transporter periplasmic adaptor subunit [Sphingobium yanoikuyae]MDH2150197.1 efflux RND transporter periplasmic adaptor subunit [Sphingobium yanoikuyae]